MFSYMLSRFLLFSYLCSFSLQWATCFHPCQSTFSFLHSNISFSLFPSLPHGPVVVSDSFLGTLIPSLSGQLPAAGRLGRTSTGRTYIQYIHVITIVDFIKANELAKRSHILQTCRRKTNVDTLQVEPRHAISPRQGIRFVRRRRDARTRVTARSTSPTILHQIRTKYSNVALTSVALAMKYVYVNARKYT